MVGLCVSVVILSTSHCKLFITLFYLLTRPCNSPDMKWVRARLGDQQLRYSYAWKTLLMHSSLTNSATSSSACTTPSSPILVVAGGSDSPIEHPNPFTGMYDAIFRTNKHRLKSTASAEEEIVFQPDECLSFSQALWIYTIGWFTYLYSVQSIYYNYL